MICKMSHKFKINYRTCLTICLVLSSMCCLSQTWGLSKQSKRTLFVPDDGSDKVEDKAEEVGKEADKLEAGGLKSNDVIDKSDDKDDDDDDNPYGEGNYQNQYFNGHNAEGHEELNYGQENYDNTGNNNYGNNKPNINYTSAPYAGPIPVHYPIPAAPVQVRPPVAPAYGSYGVNPGLQNYMRVMYGAVNYNYRAPNYQRYNTTAPQFNYGKAYNQSNNYLSGSPGGGGNGSGGHQYNRTNIRSPYQNIPGTYSPGSYGKQQYFSGKRYTAQSIYGSYLSTGAYLYHSGACAQHYSRAPEISQQDMESAFDYAYHQLRDYDRQFGNYSLFTSQSPPLKLKEKEAVLMEYVTEYLAKFKCLSKYQTTTFLPTVSVGQQYFRNRLGDTSCYSSYGGQGWTLQCPDFNNKYRTIDGSCNNRRHPYWGKSYVCHLRLLPPDYADGFQAPRLASDGSQLPAARTLINIMTSDKPFESFYTHMKMAFGQFVNHDITHTPVFFSYALSGSYSAPTDCCRNPNIRQCLPIRIEPTPYDYHYAKYNNTCMNFIRSAPCPLCEIGPRQQSNIATSFLDAGTIYGNTANDSAPIRTFRFGLLKTSQDRFGRPILPTTPAPWNNECSPPSAGMQCFYAGDQRCNQHPSLMSMHLMFLRRHNLIATSLRAVNGHWTDETLYQEARRLVIAEIQHITYNEYLRIVFGSQLMDYYSLNVLNRGYTAYEPDTDPTTWNEYATAACRFGHSQIRSFHSAFGNQSAGSYHLKDTFMDPSLLHRGLTDAVMKGLITDLSYSVDPYYTDDIKNYLMRKKGDLFGSDLISRNINRGRDHGIASYVNYLNFCFGFEVRSWDDLKLFIPEHYVNLFRQLYKSWADIDLYIAGIAEKHYVDADVGPTFACILGIQYYHIKFGDRYYYEHGNQAGSFNLAQLNNIRKSTTLARLVCLTSDQIPAVQPHAFFPVSQYNRPLNCKSYPDFDYSLWREAPNQRH